MDERHVEDCIVCRAQALGMTDEQVELLTEVVACSTIVGWTERGIVRRTPSARARMKMILAVQMAWAAMFGARVPESSEVAEHRHRHGGA